MRRLRSFALLLAVLASLGLATGPSPLNTPARIAAVPPRAIPYTDVNPLGATFFLDREVEDWKKEITLRMARDAGIGWAKIQFSWEGLEPRRGQFFDDRTKVSTWEKYDKLVALTERYGIRIIARLDRPPSWTHVQSKPPTTPPDNFEDFGNFVYAVVSHYRGRIQHFQIWNEPNLGAEWGHSNVDPVAYTHLLEVAYRRAKEANPNALILAAPLAQTLETGPLNLNELDFLEQMYQAGARTSFDIMMANGYGFDRPPDDPPRPDVLNFQRILLLRQVMERNGDAGKAVWLNEFGWNAAPATFPKERLYWQRVSEEQQAEYTLRGMDLARQWGWVGVVSFWYFRQVGDIRADDAAYYFRMVDIDFTPRLVYHALRGRSAALKVAQPGHHEETSPAVTTAGRWRYQLDSRASGGGIMVTDQPGATVSVTFNGTALKLRAATGPGQGTLTMLLDGRSTDPPGPEGACDHRLHLDTLPAALVTTIPLVQGLAPGQHTIRLSADPGGQVTIDGFEVESAPPSFTQFYGSLAAMLLGLVVVVLPIVVRKRR